MLTKCALFTLVAMLAPVAASAQAIYGGGLVAADAGTRGFDLGTIPAVGGFVGLRFHDALSIELHLDRAFGESAERERVELFGHSMVKDRAGAGRAVLFVWKVRHPARVGAALTVGLSTRLFSTDRVSITNTDPNLPLGPVVREMGVGWTGGALLPIAIGGRWSLAPEVRLTGGLTAEHGTFTQIYSGARVMWGF